LEEACLLSRILSSNSVRGPKRTMSSSRGKLILFYSLMARDFSSLDGVEADMGMELSFPVFLPQARHLHSYWTLKLLCGSIHVVVEISRGTVPYRVAKMKRSGMAGGP
jgi:hypothetical protein